MPNISNMPRTGGRTACAVVAPRDATDTRSSRSTSHRRQPAGIRMDRVAAARARLAAGLVPLSAEALADALLRADALERLCLK